MTLSRKVKASTVPLIIIGSMIVGVGAAQASKPLDSSLQLSKPAVEKLIQKQTSEVNSLELTEKTGSGLESISKEDPSEMDNLKGRRRRRRCPRYGERHRRLVEEQPSEMNVLKWAGDKNGSRCRWR